MWCPARNVKPNQPDRVQGTTDTLADAAAFERAAAGRSRIFAVWPEGYRSGLFIIDDLDQYARGMGLVHRCSG
jgi:hypothetical protein